MNQEQSQAVWDILNYLQKHPQAKHSAEGIAKYWIFQQRLEEKLDSVLYAIDFLVEQHFLEKIEKSDGSIYYKSKLGDIGGVAERLKEIHKKVKSSLEESE
jgi:Fe2+ or Zn2+ uptake regulation protein